MVACSSHNTEKCLLEVLADDRTPKRLGKIDEALATVFEYVASLNDGVLGQVAKIVGISVRRLRHDAMQAAMAQLGYLAMRLRPARSAPWCLTSGELIQKLSEFAKQPPPRRPDCWQDPPVVGDGHEPGAPRGVIEAPREARVVYEGDRARPRLGIYDHETTQRV